MTDKVIELEKKIEVERAYTQHWKDLCSKFQKENEDLKRQVDELKFRLRNLKLPVNVRTVSPNTYMR